MLRISKLTDYGTMILVHLASAKDKHLLPASDVAESTHLALPTVQKLLKILTKNGLVESARGTDGGYRLARAPEQITAAEILDTLEGPVAITECSHDDGHCDLEPNCQVGNAWQKISLAIRAAMNDIRLCDLQNPPMEFPLRHTILSKSGHKPRLHKQALGK
ncbi:MAG: SUF system Fe-S cluster assembly regulator [Gammaproteobacteria bacterium]|nr:SUF system Fe-S cluster assembly regulator [Gammaproteobacteria bacterium]MCP4091155.1 SUF system Fe-S cluster assembly regulator [Gammaproteobacteria bacterium]MCP4277319.1 SUF system Fe-S cluster assembly regulator [Gammaproteobacteria bacterium]MCP4831620.1 SUF system Fe-S cluster assembly regulator [Gammaproteobacteria bacterium]MCP4927843.1 SUF system Fe-S cluster assembly regulator [Gammaproteobacteria bacterium]